MTMTDEVRRALPHIGPPTTAAEILARSRAAAPKLRERSNDIEHARFLPPDVVQILRDTGVFRMALPKSMGGPELDSLDQTRVIEALSYGDASAGWCAMIGMDTPIYAGYLDESVAREMFPDPDMITAGLIQPFGHAERVPGGFRLTGRWAFGSGISHADWVVAGCFIYSGGEPEPNPDGGPLHWRIMFGRPDQFQIIDTWHTHGLAGSGSRDYVADELFVPEEHSFSLGQPRRTGAMYATDSILRNMPGVPLGVARAALDFVRELAASRTDRSAGTTWPETYRVQLAIGEAEMDYLAAREAVYGSLQRVWDRLAVGEELTMNERVDAALARTYSFRAARSIVSRLVDLVATTAIFRTSPLDRWLRDLTTMRQHVIAQDHILQSAGAYLLGGTPHYPFSLGLMP